MKLLKLSLILALIPGLLNAAGCSVDGDCKKGYKCYGDSPTKVCCKPNNDDSPSCDCLKQDNKTTATEITDLPSWCKCGSGNYGKLPKEIQLDKGKTTCCSSDQLRGNPNVCSSCKPHKLPGDWCKKHPKDKPFCAAGTACVKDCKCPSKMNCCVTSEIACCTTKSCSDFWYANDCSIY